MRGILKRKESKDNCVVGDIVEISEDNYIINVEERKNLVERPLVANIDYLVIQFAGKDPDIDYERLNILLLRSFYYKIKPVIIINKIDLLSAEELEEVKKNLEFLNKLDIKYFLISQKESIGIEELKVFLKDNHLYVNDEKINIREYSSLGQLGEANYWIIPKKGDTIEVIPGANYGEYTWSKGGKPVDVAEVQKQLVDNPGAVAQILPDLEFRVNGEKTGMVLDIIHDSKAVEKILSGEKVTVTADEDYYLALGDNTNGSYDSRMWGFVKESRIKGKAFVRFWPLNRISLLK